jgi:large subunit ribosomal protein L17
MRHAVRGRKLARTSAHRLALRRNLVQSLIEHGRIRTTLVKAREVRGFAEKLVSLAVDGSLAARQRAAALLNDRAIIPAERRSEYDRMSDAKREKVLRARSGRRHRTGGTAKGTPFTAEGVIHRLFSDIGPKMKQRNEKLKERSEAKTTGGGYTRIVKLAERRLGDGGQLALLEFVKPDDPKRPKGSDRTERKRRARVKYAYYAGKPLQRRGARRGGKGSDATATETQTASSASRPETEES